MMTIGQFAKRTGLSISALRFYADRRLLAPAEVDASSGYRRYAEAQVPDGILVRDLRRLDMPLSEIVAALQRSEPERKELVEQHLVRLERIVHRAHDLAQDMGITKTTEETAMSATLQTLDLAQAMDQILPAAGTDPEVPHLMSVLVEGKQGSVRLVASDRHRLAIRDLVPVNLDAEFSAVLPAATLSQWRASLNQPGEVTLRLDERQAYLNGPGADLSALIVPAAFPDYEKLLVSAEHATTVQVDHRRFLAALKAFDGEDAVVMSASEIGLNLTRDQQSIDCEAICSGPDRHVAVNPRYATEAVRNAVGSEIVMEVEDIAKPVLFRSADDGTYTTRIMPVKLD